VLDLLPKLMITGLLTGCAADPCLPLETAGALTWVQLPLGGAIGESALIVGPDGATALLDVGNDSHDDTILEAVEAWTGGASVDTVIATHFHADHIGGLSALAGALDVGQIVSRGRVHLDDANTGELEGLDALEAAGAEGVALCDEGGCALDTPLDLGGPVVQWLAADATDRDGPLLTGQLEENARSLVGVLRWGTFSLLFGGDLTGGGKDTPDVETPLADRAPLELWPADGVDILQANHHGIRSSSNDRWLERAMPPGRARQVLVGAGSGYAAAPHQDMLDAWAPRLGGGFVFASGTGGLAGSHESLKEADGAVIVQAQSDGAYEVYAGLGGVCEQFGFEGS
jgi:competence protein ComEC